MSTRFSRLLRHTGGQNLIEYGLVGALISIAAVLVLRALAPLVLALWGLVLDALSQT